MPPRKHVSRPSVRNPRYKKAVSVAANNPLWSSLGAIVGIVSVLATTFQIYQATRDDPADLEIAMTSIGGPLDVPAIGIDLASNSAAPQIPVGIFRASPIDITLRNTGGEPTLISSVIVDVEHFERLSDCTTSGAGPAGVSAEYTVRLPEASVGTGPALGEVNHDVRFEVKAGSVDRMQLTVGPEVEGLGNYPYVLGLKVSLIESGGKRLDAGKYLLAGNHRGIDANLNGSPAAECAVDNLEKIEPLMSYQSTKSTELLRLRDTFQSWAA